jgi:hypothetical protein|nr:MAG TPA: hypothetical protein [Caudoviricetes sp.]
MNNKEYKYDKQENYVYKAIASLNITAKEYIDLENNNKNNPFYAPLKILKINNNRYKRKYKNLYQMRWAGKMSRTAKNIIQQGTIGTYYLQLDFGLLNEKGIFLDSNYVKKLESFIHFNNLMFESVIGESKITIFEGEK